MGTRYGVTVGSIEDRIRWLMKDQLTDGWTGD